MGFVIGVGSFADIIIRSGRAVDWSVWFDHFWQAKDVADYATSLLDLVGAQNLSDAVTGAPPWNSATGWGFVQAQARYLDTGLIPAGLDWSMMIQYDNVLTIGDTLAGAFAGGVASFLIQPNVFGIQVDYYNGPPVSVLPAHLSGNLCIAGKDVYRDGAPDGNIGAGGGNPLLTIIIGALHLALVIQYITSDIIALGIKKGPALTAPQVAAAAAAMAAL